MKKILRYFHGILPFFAAMLIQLIIVNGMALVYSFVKGFQIAFENAAKGPTDPKDLERLVNEALSPNVLYLSGTIGVLVCGIVFYFWYRREIRGEARMSFRSILTVNRVTLLFALGLSTQFFFTGVMSLLQPFLTDLMADYAEQMEKLTSGNGFLVILLIVLVAPIAEELIFRGVILHKASKVISFTGANILQALLFGIYHWNIVQGVYAFFIGLLLGLTQNRFKKLLAPILLHMIINSSAFLAVSLPQNNLAYILSAAAGILIFVFAFARIKSLEQNQPEQLEKI